MSGPIPAELGNLTSLTHLSLHTNRLTGSIPAEIGRLSNVRVLLLTFNQLSGLVPLEVAQLIEPLSTCELIAQPDTGFLGFSNFVYMPATPPYLALGNPIYGIPLTPSLEDIKRLVDQFAADGRLTDAGVPILQANLDAAIAASVDDSEEARRQAHGFLQQFINDLRAPFDDGAIGHDDAEILRDGAGLNMFKLRSVDV